MTCDAGENRILMTHFYQTKAAGGFLQAAGSGPMGFAIPAALAAKLVHPDRPVVAVCGDGGFAMTMNGLMTALEHDIPIIVVVFNNKALGWVLHGSGPFAAEFKDFDHAAIARAMGCRGERVEDPAALAPALQEALASRVPTRDRRDDLACGVLRRHHLAAGQRSLAAPALSAASGPTVKWQRSRCLSIDRSAGRLDRSHLPTDARSVDRTGCCVRRAVPHRHRLAAQLSRWLAIACFLPPCL